VSQKIATMNAKHAIFCHKHVRELINYAMIAFNFNICLGLRLGIGLESRFGLRVHLRVP